MTDLEQALTAVGAGLEWPAAPDLAPRVRVRLERRRLRLRVVAVALAAVAVGVGAALAVPSARTAILRFLHVGAVSVERVGTLPQARERPLAAGLGAPVSRAEAERRAGVRLRLPAGAHPTRFYARPGLAAALLRVDGVPVLVAAIDGEQLGLVKKLARPGHIEPVEVRGAFGLWLAGAPHVIQYESPGGFAQVPTRLAGNTLLWYANGTTYRIEGRLERARALELARSVR